MNKLFALLVAILVSSSAFAHDPFEYRQGPGYRDYHGDSHHGQSIGRSIAEAGIGGAIAIAAVQVGAAVGSRIAQEISGTPAQQQRAQVVFMPVCDRTPFVRGGLVYADQCDGFGPVVVGRIDRR